MKVIVDLGGDRKNAAFVRAMCKSLGHEIPKEWSDAQVLQFFNTLERYDAAALATRR